MATLYAIVDRPNEQPRRQIVITRQEKQRTVGDAVFAEETDVISPTAAGHYIIGDPDHPMFKHRKSALEAKMKRENVAGQPPRIIGPFEDDPEDKPGRLSAIQKAMIEVQRKRPRTDQEKVIDAETSKKQLDSELAKAKAELEALKAELHRRKPQ